MSVFLFFFFLFFFLFLLPCFIEISEHYANSVDPDQTPLSAASDQGLHCLLMSLLWNARLIPVQVNIINA